MANVDTPGAELILGLATAVTTIAAIYLRLFLAGQLAALEKAIVNAIRQEFATKKEVELQLRNIKLEIGIHTVKHPHKPNGTDSV